MMNHGYTPPRSHRRHSRLGEKIVAAMLSASLVTSFLPASALAAPADASSTPAPASSVDAGSLPVEDMPELDTRETTIAPETLSTSGASSLAAYREDEGFSLASMFSARSDKPREGELPTEVAGTKIESLKASWRTPDDVSDNDAARLSLAPEDASQKTVQISLEAALSGQFDYDPGDISFTVPKTFLAYRDCSPAGAMKLSVPQSPSTSGMFAYVDNGDTYSVVNTKTLPAATSVLLQLEVNSIDVARMRGDASDSGRFWCNLIVKGGESGEELVGMTNNALFATFKTNATVKSATDTVQNLYDKYPSSFPAELKPANDGDYIYIDWYSYAHIEGNQYFDVSATSTLSGFSGGTVLGMKDNTGKIYAAPAGSSSFTAELAKSAYQTGQGYYLHTYAAYPRSGLQNDVTSTFSHDVSYVLTTVDTKAASSARASAQKSYTPKEWETPVGHFGMGKHGYNTYHLALNDLLNGEDQLAYFDLKTLGFGAPFTTDKYYGTNDKIPPEELGKKSYKLITDDYDTWFNNSTTPLTSENFELSSMKVDKPVMYEYKLFDADGRGWTENAEGSIAETTVPAGSYGYKATDDMSNQPLIVIEGSVNGSSAYTKFGEIQWKADGTVYTKGFSGASWSGTTLTFPANVTDTRQTAETCGHGIVYMVHPTVKIKANAATIAQARSLFDNSDSPSTYVRNEAKAHALVRQYHYEGQVLVEGWRSTDDVVQGGDDTLRGAASGVSLSAETTVREPSTGGNPTKDYLFNYVVQLNNQSNITNLDAYNEAVEQGYISQEMSGSWFCLLPPGVHYYKASYVGKRSGDRIVNQTVVENWRGSGRDMLIVDMSQTPTPRYYMATDYLMGKSGYADRPYISFLASMSVEDVEEFGCDTRLVAAYQSNNDEIGTVKGFRGEPNDPMFGNHHESAQAVGTYAAEMTGLSSSYPHNENGAFVYARDRSPISVNRSGVTGLQKYVSVDGGTTWTNGQGGNEANVYGGQEYSYRLRNGATDDEKNVVIYDQLECAKDLGLAGTDATDATWRGKLESVDVSRMVAAGVSPVVYYSTAEGLDIDGSATDRNLSNASIWSTTPPADMSKVTAVAIDASKSRDGSDFVLKSGRSLTATVNMRAPLVTELIAKAKSEGVETTGADWYDSTVDSTQEAEDGFKGGAHALNGTTRTSTIVGGTNQKTTTSYTKVGLKPFKVELSKSWDDDSNHDGYRPASVDVDIFGNGTLAKTVTLTDEGATGDAWSKLVVDDLPYLDAAGGKISYTFAERMGDVASANYKSSIDDNEAQDAKGAVLSVAMTNTHTLDPVSAHVEKIWSDGAEGIDDYDKIRPDSVTVKICRDAGNTRYTVRTLVLSAENNWSADVDDLPQLYQGQPVSYSVWEQVPSGYRYSYTIDGASNKSVTVGPDKKHFDVAITNVHVPETRTFTFNKVWNDGNNHDKKRPGEVFVDVYANGNKLEGATVRLSVDNGWTATTGSLYKNDGAGNEISYTFKERGENIYEAGSATVEQMSQGYTSAVDMSRYAAGKIEIENTHRILMSTFPIAKHWDDNGNEAGARPESVVIDVYANGKFFRQEVLTGPATAGTWEEHVSYEDLDASGNPIVYTFKEHEPVPGYYCVQEDEEIPEMTNVYYPYGNIAIEKTVENATDVSSATDFSFKVEVTHEDGTPDAGTYAWTSSDGHTGTVENGGTVSIKGGQSVTIEKVPSECSYRIEELYAPGWRATGDGYVRTGKIVPRSDNKTSFTNMYSATGRVNFSASKNVEGTDLRSSQFVFELNRVADDGSRTLVGTAYNASGGQVSFGSELYSLQDVGKTFHYQISERDTGRAGYAYDGSVFDAYVKVVDDGDGSLSGQVTYSKDGAQVDVPTFTNVYSASGTVSPSAHKVLKGQDLKDGMFSFKLTDKATGEQVGNLATNDIDGNIAFGAISYDESDAGHTYYYEMSEIAGNDETVIYSTETYLYEVKVRDNRNGTLSFDTRTYKPYAAPEEGDGSDNVPAEDVVEIDGAQYVEAQPVFTNDSVPGTLVLEKKVDGVAGQDYDPSAEFTFHVTLNSPGDYEFDREEKTDAWAVYTDDDKTMRFVRASSEDKAKARVAEVRGTALPSEADSVKAWTGFEDIATGIDEWGNSVCPEPDWREHNESYEFLFDIGKIKKVDIIDKVAPLAINSWFSNFKELETVDGLANLDLSKCTFISGMFQSCSKLSHVAAQEMDVSNVQELSWVFSECGVEYLDLSTWDTRRCERTSRIFGGYNSKLKKVKIGKNLILPVRGNYETGAIGASLYVSESTGELYHGSQNISDSDWYSIIDIPMGVEDTYYLPRSETLYALYLQNNTLVLTRLAEGIPNAGDSYQNSNIASIVEIPGDDVTSGCLNSFKSTAKTITIQDKIYSTTYENAFADFTELENLEGLENITVKEGFVSSLEGMFKNCKKLKGNIIISGWNGSISINSMFEGCSSINAVDFATSSLSLTEMDSTFKNCFSLRKINLQGIKFSHGMYDRTSIYDAFLNCYNLNKIDFSSCGNVSINGGSGPFSSSGIEILDVSNFTFGASGNFFRNMNSLETVIVGENFVNPIGTNPNDYFAGKTYLPAGTWVAQSDGTEYTEKTIPSGKADTYVRKMNKYGVYTPDSKELHIIQSASEDDAKSIVSSSASNLQTFSIDENSDGGAPWSSLGVGMIDKVFIKTKLSPVNTSGWFKDVGATSIEGLENIDMSRCYSMSEMFMGNGELSSLHGISGWNLSNMENMGAAFRGCINLSDFDDISQWNTSKVTNMSELFWEMYSLDSIDLSGWDTASIVNPPNGQTSSMVNMFEDAHFNKITLGEKFVTKNDGEEAWQKFKFPQGEWKSSADGNVYAHDAIPSGVAATYTKQVPAYVAIYTKALSSWSSQYVIVFNRGNNIPDSYMYNNEEYTLSQSFGANASDGIDIENTDYGDSVSPGWKNASGQLKGIVVEAPISPISTCDWFSYTYPESASIEGLANIDMSHVKNMSRMFAGSNCTSLDVGTWDLSSVENMKEAFASTNALTSLDTKNWNLSSVRNMGSLFYQSAIQNLDTSNWDVSQVEDMSWMFMQCNNIQDIDVSNWDVRNVKNFNRTFATFGSDSFKNLDISKWTNPGNVTDMEHMLHGAKAEHIAFNEGFDTSNVTNMGYLFASMSNLKTIELPDNWNTSNVESFGSLFYECNNLQNLQQVFDMFDMSSATDISNMFYGCSNTSTIDMSGASISNVTNAYGLFQGCSLLTNIELSQNEMPKVEDISAMFSGCTSLTTVNLSAIGANNTDTHDIRCWNTFQDCTALREVTLGAGLTFSDSDEYNRLAFPDGQWISSADGTTYNNNKIPSGVASTYTKTDSSSTSFGLFSLLNFFDPPSTNAAELGENSGEALKSAKGIPIGSPFVGEQQRNLVVEQGRAANNGAGLLMGTNSSAVMADQAVMFATGDIASGTTGTCTWRITSDGEFILAPTSGTTGTTGYWPWAGYGSFYYPPWRSNASKINKVSISGTITFKECSHAFSFKNITSLDISNIRTNGVTDFSDMFCETSKLKNIVGLDKINTASATKMDRMFYQSGMESFDSNTYSNIVTSKVTSMFAMFGFSKMSSIDISRFNTSSVTTMESLFYGSSSLNTVTLGSINMSKVTKFGKMFKGCSQLNTINVSSVPNILSAVDFDSMFSDCRKLTYIPFVFDNTAPEKVSHMFENCTVLQQLDLSQMSTSKITDMTAMFSGCSSLEEVGVHNFDTSKVTSMANLFRDCEKINLGSLDNFDVSSLTDTAGMFCNCSDPDYTMIDRIDWSKVTYKGEMYAKTRCSEATLPELFITESDRWNASGMFGTCSNLSTIDLSNISYVPSDVFSNSNNISTIKMGTDTKLYQENNEWGAAFGDKNTYWKSTDATEHGPYSLAELSNASMSEPSRTAGTWTRVNMVNAETGSFDVQIHPNESIVLNNIPAGTTYSVTESTNNAGWSIVTDGTSGTFGTIQPATTTTVTIQNKYEPGSTDVTIRAAKLLDGKPATELCDDGQGKFVFGLFESSYNSSTGQYDPIGEPLYTAHNNSLGEIIFDTMTFTQPTSKSYIMCEIGCFDESEEYKYNISDKHENVYINVYDASDGYLSGYVSYGTYPMPVFENTTKSGTLKIVKRTNIDTDRKFDFSVHYITSDNVQHEEQISLGQDEEYVIDNLLAGSAYNIEEKEIPAGWTQSSAQNTSGVIEPMKQSIAEIDNAYSTRPTSVVLTATKSMLDGSAMEDGKYAFDLYELASDATEIPADATPVQQAHSTENGDISFDMLTFTTPGTHRFAIKENLENTDATVNYDTHVELVDVTVTDDSEGSLVAQVSYDDDGANFVNSHKAAHLKVSKTATGVSDAFADRSYAFDVALRDASGNLLDGAYPYKVYAQGGTTRAGNDTREENESATTDMEVASSTVSANGTIELKSGQYAVIDLPVNTSYEITEKTPSGFVCDAQGNIGTITVDDATRTIESVFTNTYFANGTVKLTASKEARGFKLADNQFSFALTDEDGNMVSTAKNSIDGTIEFPSVAYTASDIGKTFVYNISEVNDGQRNIEYDNGSYSAVVSVADNGDGTLSTDTVIVKGDVKYAEDGSIDYGSMETVAAGENVFVNSYSLAMPFSGETGAPVLAILGLLLAIAGVFAIRRRSATDMGHEHTENKNVRNSRNK